MLKLFGRKASPPSPKGLPLPVAASAQLSPKPIPALAIPAPSSPVGSERDVGAIGTARRDSEDSFFEDLGALGGDAEWLSPDKPAVTNADILSIQDSRYVPQPPIQSAARWTDSRSGGVGGSGSLQGGYTSAYSDRFSPGSFQAGPNPAESPATNRKLFATGPDDEQSWLVAAPGDSDFGGAHDFMADNGSPRDGGYQRQPFSPSPSKIPHAPNTPSGRTKIPKPVVGGGVSAGRDMGRSRIPGSPSPAAQPSTERAQLARRYEQSPSFIPDTPPGYVPSSHDSMSSLAPSTADRQGGSEVAAAPHATANGAAGKGGQMTHSQSHDSFEEAERLVAEAERFGSKSPSPLADSGAAPARAQSDGQGAPSESQAAPSIRPATASAAAVSGATADAGGKTKSDGKQNPAAPAAADDKVKSGGCLCFKW